MIDQLIKLVEQHAGEAIVQNKAVPDQFNSSAIQEVAQQIFGGLQNQVGQGNLQDVTAMFNGASGSLSGNPMVAQMITNIAGSFASKFGVSPQAAQSIAGSLIPQVMNQFINKTNDPNDSDFDLQNMMQSFSGNSGLDIGDLLGKVTGGSSSQGSGDLGGMLGKIFN